MSKKFAGVAFTVPVLLTAALYPTDGSTYPASNTKFSRSHYFLTSGEEALVLVPLANAAYAEAANYLYLEPNGFDGIATNFTVPETSGLVASVTPGVQVLVQAVESQYTAGDFGPDDPLYIFGYSQGAVEEGLAEQQLHDFGIPEDALHLVMVGDSASTEGGFLNSFVESFPESWQQPITELLTLGGVTAPTLGAMTPDNLYPTDVYTLTGDGWANWDSGANIPGMFFDHLAYLDLSPAEIANATLTTDGLTDYFTIDSASVDIWSALWNELLVELDIVPYADAIP
jgi:PE-PPE domain